MRSFTLCIWVTLLSSISGQVTIEDEPPVPPALTYISTLDGTFYALDAETGVEQWSIKEDKVVNVPKHFQKDQKFFPDPLDGSLYVVNRGNIEKLAHTIPEMVHSSPMRTRNGLLYSGKKTDYWVALDPNSGDKRASVTDDGVEKCTAVTQEESSLFVGKTEYSLTIVDSKTATQTWNVTYVSYAAPQLTDVEYQYTHYASSSDGKIITFDTQSKKMLWHSRLVSPIISIFVERYGSLLRVPFRTLASDTMMSYIIKDLRDLIVEQQKDVVSCLFIGKYAGGIYAMNEMMHAYDVNSPRTVYPRIGGNDEEGLEKGDVHVIGRHVLPMLADHLLISHVAVESRREGYYYKQCWTPYKRGEVPAEYFEHSDIDRHTFTQGLQGQRPDYAVDKARQRHYRPAQLSYQDGGGSRTVKTREDTGDPLKTYLIIASGVGITVVVAVFVAMCVMCGMINNLNKNSNSGSAQVPAKSKHTYKVGKIDVYLGDIIGHGSEGTCVFKGKFENRQVAVKRVLLDFIDIDLHEVELLRQADEHPNVIRYFCMETDNMFRYLALELCAASLRDYVENTIFVKTLGQDKSLLYQTISGLRHLHSLNIVHRDIKPGNILITKCTKKSNTLKALISDFGLCRKISEGRQSLTARTGSAGTDGWIAPEMLMPASKISCAVDIFSYGCIMYYVLSRGQHPFGNDVYRRQANILNYDYDLSALSEPTQDNVLGVSLICAAVGNEKIHRPTSTAVFMHPYFWNAGKQLRFYSDVSDRVEKEEFSELVLRWEHNCIGPVLRGGWMLQCPELERDLYKYRKYRTESIRDLLRAMRNKRHHYRELPEDLRNTLGDIPDGYVNYFSTRFPKLLLHTYTIMTECANECVFRPYYPEINTFKEERIELYEPCPRPHSSERLALSSAGDYSNSEVIEPAPPPVPITPSPAKDKKQNQKKKGEVLNWRKKRNNDSDSSHRSSEFRHDSPPRNNPTPVHKTDNFAIKTQNKFNVFNDENDSGTENNTVSPPPGFSEKPAGTPAGGAWFQKYHTTDEYGPYKRKVNHTDGNNEK